ncbi:MAG: DUF1553 domain-containing protein [Planctomycetes bacterium]|nr:DUF1553 domain-containing protein [Planctomycetota bacterium]
MWRFVPQTLMLTLLGTIAIAAEPHWAFRELRRPVPPIVTANGLPADGPRNSIDAFIRVRLSMEKLVPSPPADRSTLVRRTTLELIGLPPSPDEVEEFLAETRPDAFERLVDRLQASPQSGERWARSWLDLCHYGDSDGHLTDQLRPVAWRYRDWVTRMWNDNLPFDQFTLRQLAGDLLVPPGQTDPLDVILGTGFLRQTLSNREGGADLEEYRVAQVVDRTSMIGAIWLGLTVGCARCHDHKYDPLSQAEFFQLYSYFDNADEVNIDAPVPGEAADYVRARAEYDRRRQAILEPVHAELDELQRRWEANCLHAAAHPGQDHVWDRQWELLGLIWGGNLGEGQLEGCAIVRRPWPNRTRRQQQDLLDYFLGRGSIVDEKRFAELKLSAVQKQLADLKAEFPRAFPTRAPVIQTALNPRQTYLHERGDFRSRGTDVTAGTPGWLPSSPEQDQTRLSLARWLVSPQNPLTGRVTVNRLWQEFFGRGLVATSDDFGTRGDPPSHPELLDWLASEFVGGGWDVKRIQRIIVCSATYRQSSRPREDLMSVDPDNVWLARQASLRISAEAVRDSALQVSGLLSTKFGGPSVYPPQHERVTMEAFGSNVWKASAGEDRFRRGLYTFIQRTSPFAQSIIFDAPVPLDVCTRRDRSNSPLQALTLLNDPVFAELAEGLAGRIVREAGPADEDRIPFAIRLCLGRTAEPAEVERLQQFLADCRRRDTSRCWTNLASVLLNLHEFITRD